MKEYDVIIVGGGPAGATCAMYLKRSNINVLVIENGASALKMAEIENYYGIKKISGLDLYNVGLEQLKKLDIEVINAEVLSIEYGDKGYSVYIKEDNFKCNYLVLATGASRKSPNIKNIANFEGKGVSYCAICDGFLYRNQNVAVIGNGDYALHEAELLKQMGVNVRIYLNGKPKQFKSNDFKIIPSRIISIEGQTEVEKICCENFIYDESGVFVAIGTANAIDFAKKLGIDVNNNQIQVNERYETNAQNIYAIGDAIGGTLQVSKAVYDGMKCGLEIINQEKNK